MIKTKVSSSTYVVTDDENSPHYVVGVFEDGYFKFTCDFGLTSENLLQITQRVIEIEKELGLTPNRAVESDSEESPLPLAQDEEEYDLEEEVEPYYSVSCVLYDKDLGVELTFSRSFFDSKEIKPFCDALSAKYPGMDFGIEKREFFDTK